MQRNTGNIAHSEQYRDKVKAVRLRWVGHVQRRDSGYIGQRMLIIELPCRKERGRPRRRFIDAVKEDPLW